MIKLAELTFYENIVLKNIQENIYWSFYILLHVFETVWYLIYSAVANYL